MDDEPSIDDEVIPEINQFTITPHKFLPYINGESSIKKSKNPEERKRQGENRAQKEKTWKRDYV